MNYNTYSRKDEENVNYSDLLDYEASIGINGAKYCLLGAAIGGGEGAIAGGIAGSVAGVIREYAAKRSGKKVRDVPDELLPSLSRKVGHVIGQILLTTFS